MHLFGLVFLKDVETRCQVVFNFLVFMVIQIQTIEQIQMLDYFLGSLTMFERDIIKVLVVLKHCHSVALQVNNHQYISIQYNT